MNMANIIYKLIKRFSPLQSLLYLSIKHRGKIGSPIIISKNGEILDGATRYYIAKKLGFKYIDVIIIDKDIEMVSIDIIKETY